jgi:hypothetical protein
MNNNEDDPMNAVLNKHPDPAYVKPFQDRQAMILSRSPVERTKLMAEVLALFESAPDEATAQTLLNAARSLAATTVRDTAITPPTEGDVLAWRKCGQFGEQVKEQWEVVPASLVAFRPAQYPHWTELP